FFFQAEDGIRDFHVTGVQTCALPISGAMTQGFKEKWDEFMARFEQWWENTWLARMMKQLGALFNPGSDRQAQLEVEFLKRDRLEPEFVQERSEEHTSELQSRENLVCRLLLEKIKK